MKKPLPIFPALPFSIAATIRMAAIGRKSNPTTFMNLDISKKLSICPESHDKEFAEVRFDEIFVFTKHSLRYLPTSTMKFTNSRPFNQGLAYFLLRLPKKLCQGSHAAKK